MEPRRNAKRRETNKAAAWSRVGSSTGGGKASSLDSISVAMFASRETESSLGSHGVGIVGGQRTVVMLLHGVIGVR